MELENDYMILNKNDNRKNHNPNSSLLIGNLKNSDIIKVRK